MKTEKLGTLLVQQGAITPGELSLGLGVQDVSCGQERLGDILCQYDLLEEKDLASLLAEQSGWPVFEGVYEINERIVQALGYEFLEKHVIFPLQQPQGVVFVLTDPGDMPTSDHLLSRWPEAKFFLGVPDKVKVALKANIKEESVARNAQGSVRDAAAALLDEAESCGATDIHIEPSQRAVEVRFRVDGVLRFQRSFPLSELARLVNVFFNRAQISAGDFLRFHDARFDHGEGSRKVDVRLSHIPSINGPSLVLRLLYPTRSALSLASLGYAAHHLAVIERALRKPHGIILVAGPTGCGKTTTLYAMLRSLKSVGTKIVSAEDPVEIRLPLVTQVPVDIKKAHDFHHLTRAFLRHDPDIILIGEIRDEKTAAEGIRAAITGHQVLSTLHTHDAVSALLRLHDLGVDHGYMANTISLVVAQRLVRCLCPGCRQEEFVTPQSLPEYEKPFVIGPGQVVYRARPQGCAQCFEGYRGRTVVAETLLINEQMRLMIEQGLINELYLKVRQDQESMRVDAARLVCKGVTSLDEVARVVG